MDKCYVRMTMHVAGSDSEGKLRYKVKEEVICSCSCDEDEKTILQRFLDWLSRPVPRPEPDPFGFAPGGNNRGGPLFGPGGGLISPPPGVIP
jgi:hypothetical protein